MAINRHYGTNMVDAGNSRRPMSLDGTLHHRVGLAVATPSTVEAVLLSLTIPGGAICSKGKGLRIRAIFSSLASGTTKVYSVRYGSLTGTVIATTNSAVNNTEVLMDAYLLLTNESTGAWEGYGWFQHATANSTSARVAGTDDVQDEFNLAITGTSSSLAGDVVLRAVSVELLTEGGLTPG